MDEYEGRGLLLDSSSRDKDAWWKEFTAFGALLNASYEESHHTPVTMDTMSLGKGTADFRISNGPEDQIPVPKLAQSGFTLYSIDSYMGV